MDQSTFDSPLGAASSHLSPGGISSLLLASLLVLIVSGYLIKFVSERRRLYRLFKRNNIPSIGNPKLFSGNLYDTYTKPDNVFIIDKYHKRLGATFGLFFGPDPWVQTTDLELLHRVFLAEDSVHIDRTLLNFPFTAELGESLAQVRGEKWRRTRRVIAPSFHERQMKADNVNLEIGRISEQFLEFVEAHSTDQDGARKVDVDYAMKRFTLEVIFRLAFGQVRYERFVPAERDPLIDSVLKASLVFNGFALQTSIMFAPLRRLLGMFVPLTLLGSILASIHAVIGKSLEIRHKLYEQVGRNIARADRKMIDSLIEGKDLGKMDNLLFRANLYFMLLAGHETTSFALTCLLFELAWAPQTQDRLRQEVLVRGEQAEYLDWCIKEAMRLHPPVPSGIGRILERDIEHNGMRLPKGLSVNASIWSVHHSQEHWGADVEQFRPERMSEPVGEQPSAQMRYFAFGYGIRGCVGKSLAKAEMRDLVSKLIVRYKIRPSQKTPRKLDYSSPNFYHWMLNKPFDLEFSKVV